MDASTREEAARLLDAIEVDDSRCAAAPGPGCGATLPLEPNIGLIAGALERAERRGAARLRSALLLGAAKAADIDAYGLAEWPEDQARSGDASGDPP
jgi:hypothetical protein